jgi:hypothetical protein
MMTLSNPRYVLVGHCGLQTTAEDGGELGVVLGEPNYISPSTTPYGVHYLQVSGMDMRWVE